MWFFFNNFFTGVPVLLLTKDDYYIIMIPWYVITIFCGLHNSIL